MSETKEINRNHLILNYVVNSLIKEANKQNMKVISVSTTGSLGSPKDNKGSISRICTERIYDILRDKKINPPSRENERTGQVFPAVYIEIWARDSSGLTLKPTLDPFREDIRNKISLAITGKNYIEKSDPFPTLESKCKKTYISKNDYQLPIEQIYSKLYSSGIIEDLINSLNDFEKKLEKIELIN